MAIVGTTPIVPPWDKGEIITLSGTGITTSYQYSEVVPDGTSPTKFPPAQQSGQARQLALYVYAKTLAGSAITAVTVDIEVCYGDPTVAVNWAKVLAKLHSGGGTVNVDLTATLGAAAKEGTFLVTCTEFLLAKHVRVGARADQIGQVGDLLKVFMAAW